MTRNANRRSLHLFVLVILATSTLLIAGWSIGSALGGKWAPLLAGLGGALGAAIGGEVGYHKGFFEARWDRLMMGGPWVGYGVAVITTTLAGFAGVLLVLSAILGAGIGAIVAKYLLRFFVHDPPLSIK